MKQNTHHYKPHPHLFISNRGSLTTSRVHIQMNNNSRNNKNNNIILSTLIAITAAAAAKSLQSCPTLCDPTDGSPPGSLVPGILHWSGLPFPSPMHESEK